MRALLIYLLHILLDDTRRGDMLAIWPMRRGRYSRSRRAFQSTDNFTAGIGARVAASIDTRRCCVDRSFT